MSMHRFFRRLPLAATLLAGLAAAYAGSLDLRLSVVGAPRESHASVDLGTLSARPGAPSRQRVIERRMRVALRLEGSPATARVWVALAEDVPGCVVRVDGQTVSTVPRLITPLHRVGSTVLHEVEMTIASSVSPGPLLTNLQWTAEGD